MLSPINALLLVASIATPQFVHEPPEKPIVLTPLLVSGLGITVESKTVPVKTYTLSLFAVHTVCPVTGFEAHELMTSAVAIVVSVMLVPSIFTTETPVLKQDQQPFGT